MLKKKQDIIDLLSNHRYYDGRLAWNVKTRAANFDFDHLLEVYRRSGGYGSDETYLDDLEWRRAAKAIYDEKAKSLVDRAYENAQDNVYETETWKRLPSGKSVNVEYSFEGRSNGWLTLVSLDGYKLNSEPEWREWDYPTLFKLGQLVQWLDQEWTPSKACETVEWYAACLFVDVLCEDIARPVSRPAKFNWGKRRKSS